MSIGAALVPPSLWSSFAGCAAHCLCCCDLRAQVGYQDEFCRDEREVKYWSECSVSEDFDLYIRLASNNMFGRYVM